MSSRRPREEAGVSEYLAVVMRHRWLIIGVYAIALVIAFVVTLRTPRWYDASASILVPKEAGPTGLLGGLAASAFVQQAALLGASEQQIMRAISRALAT